jgi:hypothetical protein
MSALLDKLHNAARGSVSSTQALSRLFAPLDLKLLRKQINIEEKARANGADNLPSSNATQLDSVESEIVASANHALKNYIDEYETQHEAYQVRIDNSVSVLRDFSIVTEFKRTLSDLKGSIKDWKTPIFDGEERIKALAGEIRRFREVHALTEKTPVSSKPRSAISKILLAGLFEAILTFFLIREAGDLLTIVGVSVIFIALNVLVVFGFGHAAKYVNSVKDGQPDRIWRFIGWFACIACLTYVVVLNLGFSHLRSASSEVESILAVNPDAYWQVFQLVGEHAKNQLIAQWFLLPDLPSYALLLIGFFIAVYSFRHGYLFNDRYPGYGDFANRYEKLFREYSDLSEQTIARFQNERDSGMKNAEAAITHLRTTDQSLPHIVSNAQGLEHRFYQALEALNLDLKVLIQEYRSENMRTRSDSPPAHFDEIPELQKPEIRKFPHIDIVSGSAMIEAIQNYREEVFRDFDAAIHEITDLRELLESQYPFRVE